MGGVAEPEDEDEVIEVVEGLERRELLPFVVVLVVPVELLFLSSSLLRLIAGCMIESVMFESVGEGECFLFWPREETVCI